MKTGQVLAVIDQVPYRAALRTAQANVSAAQAKVETARIELRGKQALFDEKVISDYELSLARNQLAVACAIDGATCFGNTRKSPTLRSSALTQTC